MCVGVSAHIYSVSVCVFTLRFVASVMISFFLLSSGLSSCDIIIHHHQRSLGPTWVGWTRPTSADLRASRTLFIFLLALLFSFLSISLNILSCFIEFLFFKFECSYHLMFIWFCVRSVINLKTDSIKRQIDLFKDLLKTYCDNDCINMHTLCYKIKYYNVLL